MAEKYGYNHGDFGWNELMTPDAKAATEFYTKVFGWKTESFPMPGMDYTVLVNNSEKIGGIMATPKEAEGTPPMWTGYVTVDDVDATAKKIEEEGGQLLVPPQDIPEVGRFTVFKDPQGACLAAITYAKQD